MEILSKLLWIFTPVIVVSIGIFFQRKAAKKRKAEEQRRRDESVLLNLYNRMNSYDYREYKALPDFEARLKFLDMHYPEFVEAMARLYPESDYDYAIANNLDMRFLRDNTIQGHDGRYKTAEALRIYRTTARAMSLNEYQGILDKKNEEHRKQLEALAKQKAEREAREAAELAQKKKAAKKYWKSLNPTQKAAFKSARGSAARKKALPATSTDYSMDALYPLIIATQFSGINPNTSQSIDYCESSNHGGGSFGHFDGGSFDGGGGGGGWSDGGGSSSSDSGGGGGDGGGGGGD